MVETPSVFRFRLVDLFVGMTIVAVVMGGSLSVHRWMLNGPNAYWRELSQEQRHLLPTPVSLFRRHAIHWALFHVGCALASWLVLRQLALERQSHRDALESQRQRMRGEGRTPLLFALFDSSSDADAVATSLLGLGFAIPVLMAPFVPMWNQPGYPMSYCLLACVFAGVLANRFAGASILLLLWFVWFYLSFDYALSIWD